MVGCSFLFISSSLSLRSYFRETHAEPLNFKIGNRPTITNGWMIGIVVHKVFVAAKC